MRINLIIFLLILFGCNQEENKYASKEVFLKHFPKSYMMVIEANESEGFSYTPNVKKDICLIVSYNGGETWKKVAFSDGIKKLTYMPKAPNFFAYKIVPSSIELNKSKNKIIPFGYLNIVSN